MMKLKRRIINIVITLTVVLLLWSTVSLVSFAVEDIAEDLISAYATDADFEKSIAGFPEEYKPYLRELHEKYPLWTFIPFETGLDWNEVIDNELGVKNLVSNSASSENLKSKESGHYNQSTGKYIQKDAGFVVANRLAVEYYMDPRNFLNEEGIFQFEELTFNPAVTIDDIESVLKGSFMANKKITYYNAAGELKKASVTYAERIYEAGELYNVNPCYLASKIRNEVGADGSGSVSGTNARYPGIYNFYNIGATDGVGAIERGLKWASEGTTYSRPWNTPGKSIKGGAKYIAEKYIAIGQHTGYLQKFNVNPDNKSHSLYTHQYMTNLTGACSQGYTNYTAYAKTGALYQSKSFSVPVYENMPDHNTDVQKMSNADSLYQYGEIATTDPTRVRTGPSTNNAQLYDENGNAILLAKGTSVRILSKVSTDAVYYISTLKYPHWVNIQFKYNSKNYTGYVPEDFVKYTSHTSVGIGEHKISHFKGDKVSVKLISSNSAIAKVGTDNTVNFLKTGTVYLTSFDSAGRYDIVKYVVSATDVAAPEDVNLITDTDGSRVVSSQVDGAVRYNFGISDANGNVIDCVASDTAESVIEALAKSSKYTVSARVLLSSSSKIYSPCYTREFSGDGVVLKPSAVANFLAESKGSDVKFIWDEVEFCDGYIIYGYKTSTKKYTEIATFDQYETFYETDRSLLTYDKYYIRAFSVADSDKVYSDYSDALTIHDAPAVPANLTAVGATTSSVTLKWDKVTGAESYYIYEVIGGISEIVGTTKQTIFTVNNIGVSEEKAYAVASCSKRMISGNSKVVYAMTAPEQVTNLVVKSVSDSAVSLSWDASVGAYYYNVYMLQDGEYKLMTRCDDTTCKINKLEQFTDYKFKVAAVAQGEFVSQTGEMSYEADVVTRLSKVEDVTADSVRGNNVTLSWQENPKAEKYAVYVYSDEVKDFEEVCVTENAYATVTMKKYNTEYTFAVKAVSSRNYVDIYSDLSDSAKATTTYTVPENIRVSEIKAASYKLSWDKIADALNYKVYRLENGSYKHLVSVTGNSYIIGNLSQGKVDSYKITAVYKDGSKKAESDFSGEITASTTPGKVKSLKATAYTDRVALTWTEVAGADYYNVYLTEDGDYTFLGSASEGAFEATDLECGVTYEFSVRAYIEITNSTVKGNTVSLKVTTKPEKVTGVKVSNVTAYGHTISWSQAQGANYYHIYRYSSAEGKYVAVAKTEALSYSFEDLSAGKTYGYKIKAVCMQNGSELSAGDFSAVYKFATTPAKVTELKSKSVTASSVSLTWKKVSGATHYQIAVYDAAKGKYVVYGTSDTNSATVRKLPSKTAAKFKVRAVRVVNEKKYYGYYSSVLSVKTK